MSMLFSHSIQNSTAPAHSKPGHNENVTAKFCFILMSYHRTAKQMARYSNNVCIKR